MQRTGTSRPGGRTARTQQAVHAAVRELLVTSGGAEITMAQIAERSGVHAATVYRRWGSVPALLLDVAADDVARSAPVRVSGRLADDLLGYARQMSASVATPGGLGFLRAIMDAVAHPATGTTGALEVLQGRLEEFRALIGAADPPSALGVIDLIDGLLAPIYLRALLSEPSTTTDEDLVRLVDNLLAVDERRRAIASGGAGAAH